MKKLLCLLLACLMLVSMCACGAKEEPTKAEEPAKPAEPEAVEEPVELEEEPVELEEDVLAVIDGTRRIKDYLDDVLVSPSSLAINKISCGYDDSNGWYVIEVDYSAETKGGGVTRERMYVAVEPSNGSFNMITVGSSTIDGTNQSYTKQIFEGLHGVLEYDVDFILENI